MEVIDRTLKYMDLYLVKDLNDIKEYSLPEGYRFVYFNNGDEKDWVEIEMSSGEFLSFEEGMEAFNHYYRNHYEELKNLCIFIENEQGEKIATSTAFYLENKVDDITGNVHWVSIKKEYQGKHLSKPLISETLKQLKKLGHKKTLLHTQTHTWLAVKVYLDMGFIPYHMENNYEGWQIIKTLTNHDSLKDVKNIKKEDIYNPLYLKVYNYLKTKYNEPFNYKIWDKEDNKIGINKDNKVYYYRYEEVNIDLFCTKNHLGKVINITKLTGGLMHKMYKVETTNKIYCIKILNSEVMQRKEAYNNFIVSETISNYAKDNNIPVSNALNINNNFINKLEDNYYMVFDYIEGKTKSDDEITIEDCKKIGRILAHIHNLDYKKIDISYSKEEYNNIYNWDSYLNNSNFNNMKYKELYLNNYKKYKSLQERANERFNEVNNSIAICHRDLDPKNVMWNNNNPIIIDWECASISNPNLELLEVALNWSGFLSNNFNIDKFKTIFKEYSNIRKIDDIEWFMIMCGNLIGRLDWLKYNLDRSLGIITNDKDEILLAENEVVKTINEINRYLELFGTINNTINNLIDYKTNDYSDIINTIVDNTNFLNNKNIEIIDNGFTNTLFTVDNYIIRICTRKENEDKFKNEIDFYKNNVNNPYIPKLYYSDITKSLVPYYYEIIEKIDGNTLYELWYKLDDLDKEKMIKKMIDIMKSFHLKEENNNMDFISFLKEKINKIKNNSTLSNEIFEILENACSKYFKENRFGLIHGDLHFDNFIYKDNNLYLIDFETSMIAPIDYDLRIITMYEDYPYYWAGYQTDMLTFNYDYNNIINMILNNYKELNEIPYIKERLTLYNLIELIHKYNHSNNKDCLDLIMKKINIIK